MPKARSSPKPAISLRELAPKEIPGIFPLIALLNPGMSKAMFKKRLGQMLPLGYRVVAAFAGEKMVGISGFWVGVRFWCGREFDIDNFVVAPEYRARNVGTRLMGWLEKQAAREECELMVLDVYTDNYLAQRFYSRAGFVAMGFHFTKVPGSRVPYGRPRF